MTMEEAEGVVQEVYERIDPDARIIWGAQVDPEMHHKMRTMLVVTGVNSPQIYGRGEESAIHSAQPRREYDIDFLR